MVDPHTETLKRMSYAWRYDLPPATPRAVPGPDPLAPFLDLVTNRGLPLYGRSLRHASGPMAQNLLSIYAAHESNYIRWTKTPPQGSAKDWREAGLAQLTIAAPPHKGEAQTHNVDPFDPTGNLWAAQAAHQAAIPKIDAGLAAAHFAAWNTIGARQASGLLWLCRAIGLSATAHALKRATLKLSPPPHLPFTAIARWAETPDAEHPWPWYGQQSPESIKHRIDFARLAVDAAHRTGIPWPEQIEPLAPRPSTLQPCPPKVWPDLDTLARRARRQGDRPSGPWTVEIPPMP